MRAKTFPFSKMFSCEMPRKNSIGLGKISFQTSYGRYVFWSLSMHNIPPHSQKCLQIKKVKQAELEKIFLQMSYVKYVAVEPGCALTYFHFQKCFLVKYLERIA
jgi:hypothetical protein